jgi:Fe-S oxidoreductase
VPSVDIDKLMEATEEADMKAGVRTARDLIWKDGLDAFTCTECGRCKDACPTHLTGKPLSLKMVNDSLKHHLVEQREAIGQSPLLLGLRVVLLVHGLQLLPLLGGAVERLQDRSHLELLHAVGEEELHRLQRRVR